MLLVAVLETTLFAELKLPPFKINPARGVDLPDLDLGVKSPSKNFCTSEPYFSAYERLLGSSHDVLVLLTDYQEAKKKPPVRLQLISAKFLRASQIADEGLCKIAKKHRAWLAEKEEAKAQRLFRFLAYVNQSDWRAKRILELIDVMQDETAVIARIEKSRTHFAATNSKRLKKNGIPLPDSELECIQRIAEVKPIYYGVLDAAENWLTEVVKDSARPPSETESKALLKSPLDGMIGMSLALQWRFNFGKIFGVNSNTEAEDCDE